MKNYGSLTNERKIVVECSRLSNINKKQLSELLEDNVNWGNILDYAMRNKVLYLLYQNLQNLDLDKSIPKTVKVLIENSMKYNVICNNMKFLELEKICKELEESGIKIVPVKGAYLIDHIYQSRAIRTTNDMDALILKKDIPRINEILKKHGYVNDKYDTESGEFVKRSPAERMLYKTRMYNLLPYIKIMNTPFQMKMEFDFSHSLDFSLNTRPVQEMIESAYWDKGVRRLLPEHYFIHMCCHHFREATHVEWIKIGKDLRLIKFCDIREFILQKMDIEIYAKAIHFAKQYDLEKAIFFVLYYLDIIYNDGYEREWMEKLSICDSSFVYRFGDDPKALSYVRKKEFWDSFFDANNLEEIVDKPKYNEVLK